MGGGDKPLTTKADVKLNCTQPQGPSVSGESVLQDDPKSGNHVGCRSLHIRYPPKSHVVKNVRMLRGGLI